MGIKQVTNNINPAIEKRLANLKPVPSKAYDFFKKVTPIRSGNARRSTDFKSTLQGGDITGNYNYANRLNAGYSRQAPQGMTKPTIEEIRRLIRRILG